LTYWSGGLLIVVPIKRKGRIMCGVHGSRVMVWQAVHRSAGDQAGRRHALREGVREDAARR